MFYRVKRVPEKIKMAGKGTKSDTRSDKSDTRVGLIINSSLEDVAVDFLEDRNSENVGAYHLVPTHSYQLTTFSSMRLVNRLCHWRCPTNLVK